MINGRKLNENISPNQRRLRLKELSGQQLTEREKDILKRKVNESVSMVEIPKNTISPTGRLLKTWNNQNKEIEDLEDEEEIDLEQILREMGYEEDPEELELGDYELDGVRDDFYDSFTREEIFEEYIKDNI
jgi:hypothetical protein